MNNSKLFVADFLFKIFRFKDVEKNVPSVPFCFALCFPRNLEKYSDSAIVKSFTKFLTFSIVFLGFAWHMKILSSTIFNLIKNYDFNPIITSGLRGGGSLCFMNKTCLPNNSFFVIGYFLLYFEKITKVFKLPFFKRCS